MLIESMAEHNELGVKGEEWAEEFLIQKGYEILAKNWRAHKFEIDLIAKKNGEIVFVEVKTRGTEYFGSPDESINEYKENHLLSGAEYYLNLHEIDLEARFDVIAIIIEKGQYELRHIENALG